MAATEQEMMERAARIQTIEELREVSAELGLELSPEKEAAFMAVRTAEGELTEQQLDATVGGAGDYVSHYQCPKTGKQLSSYDPYFARDCTMCQYWKQVIPGIRAECRY